MKKTLFLLVLFVSLFVAQNVSAQGTIPTQTLSLTAGEGSCSATVTAPTIIDGSDVTITGTTSDPVTFTGQGSYVINWTFTDSSDNVTTATQNVVVTLPTQPILACYELASFNPATCKWEVSGTQKEKPAKVNCYDDFQFDTEMCDWVNIGSQGTQPAKVNCYDDFQFDTEICDWVNIGSQGTQPEKVNCYDDFQFDTEICDWVNIGSQGTQPEKVNCYDDFQFDTEICDWVNIGSQGTQPEKVNCYDDFQFDTEICDWVNIGSQGTQPEKVNCYDDFQFDTEICDWVNIGSQGTQPEKVNCYDDFQFDTEICDWVNIGSQGTQPEKVNCYDDFQFDTEICDWVNIGSQGTQPEKVNCYDDFQFDTEICDWVNIGSQGTQPEKVNCYDDFQFDTEICDWVNIGSPVSTPTATAQTFNTGATVANLVAEGDNLSWYAGLTDEVALDSETTLSTGIYYVSQRLEVDGCESERVSVSVTVTDPFTTVSDDLANALVASGHEDLLVDGKIDNALASQVTTLDLSGQNITDLTGLEIFVNLTSLNLANNNLVSLNFGSSDAGKNANANFLTSLQTLNCSGNQLTSLDISGLTALQNLDCSSNADLTCITVKDVAAAELNTNWIKDTTASYSTECSKLAIDTPSLNNFSVVAYPNPSKNGFAMDVNTLSQEVLRIKVYDMLGKLIDQMEVNPNMISSQRIGQNYSTGIYNIVVTQEDHVQTLRVIKE